MPYVGNHVQVRDAEACFQDYELLKQQPTSTTSTSTTTTTTTTATVNGHAQNAWSAPTAKAYVEQLFREIPPGSATVLQGKLAVVTGVTVGSVGYHVALELALQAGMHVMLLGKSASKVQTCATHMYDEAARRGIRKDPVLYCQKYHLSSLQLIRDAADACISLAQSQYHGKVHVLVNHAKVGTEQAKLTQDRLEYNTGCNLIGTHYFTTLLLPLLLAAATPKYKPRIVQTSSMSHVFGTRFDPYRLMQYPMEGGAPAGYIIVSEDGNSIHEYEPPPLESEGGCDVDVDDFIVTQYNNNDDNTAPITPTPASSSFTWEERMMAVAKVGTQVGRSKMAVIADTQHFATLYPTLCFISHHPGFINDPSNVTRLPPPVASPTAVLIDEPHNRSTTNSNSVTRTTLATPSVPSSSAATVVTASTAANMTTTTTGTSGTATTASMTNTTTSGTGTATTASMTNMTTTSGTATTTSMTNTTATNTGMTMTTTLTSSTSATIATPTYFGPVGAPTAVFIDDHDDSDDDDDDDPDNNNNNSNNNSHDGVINRISPRVAAIADLTRTTTSRLSQWFKTAATAIEHAATPLVHKVRTYMTQFTPSQGARAALRAALDPDFNIEPALQGGVYLHADGNPWVVMPPTPSLLDPETHNPYTAERYAEACYEAAEAVVTDCLEQKQQLERSPTPPRTNRSSSAVTTTPRRGGSPYEPPSLITSPSSRSTRSTLAADAASRRIMEQPRKPRIPPGAE